MSKKEATEETLYFWNTSAESYSEGVRKELKDHAISDKWVRKILENAPDREKLRILDIGTGPGFFTINFARLGYDVHGIDISPEMVNVAKRNAADAGVQCDFRVMNANTLDFPDGSFDLVINRNVSWTLPDMFECYREWKRVLAPGGRIVVFDSNHYINHTDPEKARIMRMNMRRKIIAGEEPNDHFDFHVRWKYWEEDVPNIGVKRPDYDRNLLLKLRFVRIRTEEPVFPEDEFVDTGTSTPTFMICAEKPDEDTENDYIVNEYWDAVAGTVSGRAVRRLADGTAARTAEAISAYIPAGSKVLDIGTGSAPIAIELAKKGYEVTGIDRSSAMMEMAKITAEENGADVDLAVADARNLPFEDGSFDSVLLRNILWNSYHPQRIVCEAARVLRKGGIMVIEDGNWMSDISEWESSHEDRSAFPNYRKRDAGLGAFDVINEYYAKLPLNKASRPAWDKEAVAEAGLSVESCEGFDDPMVTDDLAPLKQGFILVAKK